MSTLHIYRRSDIPPNCEFSGDVVFHVPIIVTGGERRIHSRKRRIRKKHDIDNRSPAIYVRGPFRFVGISRATSETEITYTGTGPLFEINPKST